MAVARNAEFDTDQIKRLATIAVTGQQNPGRQTIDALVAQNSRQFVEAQNMIQGFRLPTEALDNPAVLRGMTNLREGRRLLRSDFQAIQQNLVHARPVSDATAISMNEFLDTVARAASPSFLRRTTVKIAMFGVVMVLASALVVGLTVGLAERGAKVRFNILSVDHVSVLDDLTASLLDHFDLGKDMDDWDPDDPADSTRTWTTVRIKYQDPSQLRLRVGHRIETRDTNTSPSIDGRTLWILETGDDTVEVAVPLRLTKNAGKGGHLVPRITLDEEFLEIAEMIDQAKDKNVGDRVDDGSEPNDSDDGADVGGAWRNNERLPLFLGLAGILVVVLIVVVIASRRSSAPRTVAAPVAAAPA